MNAHFRDDKYLDKKIKTFSSSLLNNSKWVKLISLLVENSHEIKKCSVKLIWDDTNTERFLIIDENKQFKFDYYENAMEGMISGNPKGWYAYKEIEWLDFPKNYKKKSGTEKVDQDLENINAILKRIGDTYTVISEDNLRFYAYLK